MQIDESIIEKFLGNRCSVEEATLVHEFLSRHPEVLQQYYGQDWEESATGDPLTTAHAEEMYRKITGSTKTHKVVLRNLLPLAVAAAVLVIAVTGIWVYLPKRNSVTPASQALVATPAGEKKAFISVKEEKNKTGKKKKIVLPDGTVATLSPGAGIEFKPAFDTDKREVILHGEAFFDVAKDKARPFTVYSGGLYTTALGTSFTVSITGSAVKVKLITGKVVVRAGKGVLPGWKKDIYLLPGQQMDYDAGASLVNVSGVTVNSKNERTAGNIPAPDTAREMVFDNTPLQEVFSKLAQQHKVPISYSAGDLDGLSFSGTIFYKDDLSVILKAIAQMNDFSLTGADNGFFIKKAGKE